MKSLLLRVCFAAVALGGPLPLAAQALDEAPPAPPPGSAPSYRPPALDADGYVTPNRGLSSAETVWHLRVALNVAALGCRGAGDDDLAPGYNAMLASERAPLAAAQAATEGGYRLRHGAAWAARYDDDMTRLYNYFATPPTHVAFCATAGELLRAAQTVAPADFAAFAQAALPRLETRFTEFFAAFDAYRRSLAGWQQRHPAPLIATAAAPAMAPAAVATQVASAQP